MPLLLNVLRNANGADYRKLRVKAMECAGLIGTSLRDDDITCGLPLYAAIAVGRDVFRPDANTLVELLMRIQSAFSPYFFNQTFLLIYLLGP